jgi:hypothetical protein
MQLGAVAIASYGLYKKWRLMWKTGLRNPAARGKKPCARLDLHILSRRLCKSPGEMHILRRSLYKEALQKSARRLFLYRVPVILYSTTGEASIPALWMASQGLDLHIASHKICKSPVAGHIGRRHLYMASGESRGWGGEQHFSRIW